jgi:hypothetical protein
MLPAGITVEKNAALIHSRSPAQAEEVLAESPRPEPVNIVNCFSVKIGCQRFLSTGYIHWLHSLYAGVLVRTI